MEHVVCALTLSQERLMTTTAKTREVDRLAPFLARPITTTSAEADRRLAGFKFGWDLNRLQGGNRSTVGAQLEMLYAQGRVTKPEYFELVAALATEGILTGVSDRSPNDTCEPN
jgi:hypothetical protein